MTAAISYCSRRPPGTSPEGSDGSGVVAAYYARQRAAAPVAAIERHTSTSSVGRTIRVEHWAATIDDRMLRDHSSFVTFLGHACLLVKP